MEMNPAAALGLVLVALLALRYLVILRWITYPISVLAIVIGGHDVLMAPTQESSSILLFGVVLFGVTYAMGQMQGRAWDRAEERFQEGGSCPDCGGTGRISDPFAMVMNRCGRCGGVGHG